MTREIGWHFPPTNGGREDGFGDSGVAHFDGSKIASLAREVIQNSLDARISEEVPVNVSFELVQLRSSEIGGQELCTALGACRKEADKLGDHKARAALARAEKIIGGDQVYCLKISDSNTVGLRDKNWHALVKAQGVSQKENSGAGGSHGIGKFAPFVVSQARTVFYSTRYETESGVIERLQGKAVLISHDHGGTRRQGTGFFGIKHDCMEFPKSQINAVSMSLRATSPDGEPKNGTSLVIVGFNRHLDWQYQIASSIIENYFFAIGEGQLTVTLELEQGEPEFDETKINSENLNSWFNELLYDFPIESVESEANSIVRAKAYWELLDGTSVLIEKQDVDLGHCSLYIRVNDGLPSKVALVRRTGMMITEQQKRLLYFPGMRDFAAMCVFRDPRGNEILREMENPKHDAFEPDRVFDEKKKELARRALNRIVNWIRDEIRNHAGAEVTGQSTELSELSSLLPELHPDEPFDGFQPASGGGKEQGFGERVTITLKPIRRSGLPTFSTTVDDDDDAYGDDVGTHGGSGTEDGGGSTSPASGPGDGDGEGGTGEKSGGSIQKVLPISSVRLLPIPGGGHRFHLRFNRHDASPCRIRVEEAGDSSMSPLENITTVNGEPLEQIVFPAGQRISVDLISKTSIHDRAIRVVATDATPKDAESTK